MVKRILCNEFKLEVGKLHIVSQTGSVVSVSYTHLTLPTIE